MPDKVIIGLTGGIASGKSTVSKLMESYGATIVDADKIGHLVYEPGTDCLKDVVKAIFNPKNMPHISRLLELSSNEHHNLFVNHEEQAPSHFYRKFSS